MEREIKQREIKFEYLYTDGVNWIKKAFTLDEICIGEPFEVLSDNPLLKGYKHVGERQFAGRKDKNDKDIYEGDILQFSDKWEWYRGKYGIAMAFADDKRKIELKEQYDLEPMERRKVEIPEDYEWLLSSEIQTYWEVIGNVFENPELLTL